MANQQSGFNYQYLDGLITIPFNDVVLVANGFYEVDLTTQQNAGNMMDCQSIYVDARFARAGLYFENRSTGQRIFIQPGFQGWRLFPCKTPINFRIYSLLASTISFMVSNKPIIGESIMDYATQPAVQGGVSAAGDTSILTNAFPDSYIRVGSITIGYMQPAAGAAGNTTVTLRSDITNSIIARFPIRQDVGFPDYRVLMDKSGLAFQLPSRGEGIEMNLSQAITGGGLISVNLGITYVL